MRIYTVVSLFLAYGSLLAQSNSIKSTPVKLSVGSPAPAIRVGSWAQGKPLSALKKGQVYVFEFWATWCGPCFKAMPHLSELSKKHTGKVKFVGIDVWEDRDGGYTAPKKVSKFLKENPGRMSYDVAVDSKDGFMATNWLKAAGMNSIPTTVVIGKDLKVAFIGHPMDLDLVLEPVIEGRFDAKAFANRPKTPDMGLLSKALIERDVKTLISESARIEKGWPMYKDFVAGYRFLASYIENPQGADQELTTRLDQGQASSISFALIALSDCAWLKRDELLKVSEWLERTAKKDEVEGFLAIISLPRIYQKLGDESKAAEAKERLAAVAKKMGLDESATKNLFKSGGGS